jgi:hypothetical protein
MLDDFNKNLAVFLTSCRESAIKKLTEDSSDYRKLLKDMAEFSKRIQASLSDEYDALNDCFLALTRMEINYLYLQGFKDCVNLYKRFDGSFMESQEFEKFFI